MEDLKKMVVLIDADNTQLAKLEAVIREISVYGRIVVKRAYGNWRKDSLKKWEEELKRLAIKAEQQFDYVTGKNATDMALVIDAVNLLHTGLYDGFAIVSSDSDFTPLAINLHESGVFVFGVGEKQTPESFRNSCDAFLLLENLEKTQKDGQKKNGRETGKEKADGKEKTEGRDSRTKAKQNGKGKQAAEKNDDAAPVQKKNTRQTRNGRNASDIAEDSIGRLAASAEPPELPEESFAETGSVPQESAAETFTGELSDPAAGYDETDELEKIHELLHLIWEKNQDEDGFAYVSSAGTYMKRVIPDFDPRTYGYEKLSRLLQAFPKKYDLKRTGKGKNVTVEYRCREE